MTFEEDSFYSREIAFPWFARKVNGLCEFVFCISNLEDKLPTQAVPLPQSSILLSTAVEELGGAKQLSAP